MRPLAWSSMTGILRRRGRDTRGTNTEGQSHKEAARGWPSTSHGERLPRWSSEKTKPATIFILDLQVQNCERINFWGLLGGSVVEHLPLAQGMIPGFCD